MNSDADTRRFYITPIQRVVGVLIVGLAVALCVVIVRVQPRADRIYDWRYTNAVTGIFWPPQPPMPAQSMLVMSSDPATNAFAFYRNALHLMPGGGAAFMYRSGGLFGSRRNLQEIGVIPTASRVTNLQSELYLQYHRGQSKIILVTQLAGETNSAAWVSMTISNADAAPAVSPANFMTALQYPRSQQSSGGNLMHGGGYAFTATTNLAAVEQYYRRNFGTNAPANSPQVSALKAMSDSNAHMFALPAPPGTNTNQVAFLLLTKRTMSLIHAAATGTNSTHINIGIMAR